MTKRTPAEERAEIFELRKKEMEEFLDKDHDDDYYELKAQDDKQRARDIRDTQWGKYYDR